MHVYLFRYAKCMLYSEQPTILLARSHLNTMILTNFENLNSISNIFQEISFDVPSNYLYLFKKQRQTFPDQGNVRHPTSKLIKYDLVQTLNTFRNPSLRILLPGRHLLFISNLFFVEKLKIAPAYTSQLP